MPLLNFDDLPHYTYEEYVQWEGRWELIDGIAYAMSPAPSIQHQRVSQRIAALLDEALKDCPGCQPLLPVDWKIDEHTVVQPDNMVICHEASGSYLSQAPSVVFEIVSASTRHKDEKTKYRLYEMQSVRYYCIVNPQTNSIKIFELIDAHYVDRSESALGLFTFKLPECEWTLDCGKIWN